VCAPVYPLPSPFVLTFSPSFEAGAAVRLTIFPMGLPFDIAMALQTIPRCLLSVLPNDLYLIPVPRDRFDVVHSDRLHPLLKTEQRTSLSRVEFGGCFSMALRRQLVPFPFFSGLFLTLCFGFFPFALYQLFFTCLPRMISSHECFPFSTEKRRRISCSPLSLRHLPLSSSRFFLLRYLAG